MIITCTVTGSRTSVKGMLLLYLFLNIYTAAAAKPAIMEHTV
jgi:hypothetical protein